MNTRTTETITIGIAMTTPSFVSINIPHLVKQINIKGMVYADNTTFPRSQYCLHSSLINNECLTFVAVNSITQLPNTTRFVYIEPITIQGQYLFFLRDFIGNLTPSPSFSGFFLTLEFLNFVEDDEKKTLF